jgi:isopenicillin N synthase-like dioxygenase
MAVATNTGGTLDVPVIDISPFREPGSEGARDAVAAAVDRAARTVGFMQIVGHGVAQATLDAFVAALDAFFARDPAEKGAYRCPPGVNRGYTPPKAESLANSLGLASAADLFEAFNVGVEHTDFPDLDLSPDDYEPNVWPDLPGFRPAVEAWFAAAQGVAHIMVRVFGRALGLGEEYLARFDGHSVDVLRMINYRLPSVDMELEPEQVGMGAHTDYGIVTVLWADGMPGLEILDDAGAWHPVQPAPGALLVNLGDAMARWTNDRWVSTLHRVVNPDEGEVAGSRRQSVIFFHNPNYDAEIRCIPTCVEPGAEPKYEPITSGAHLRRLFTATQNVP